MNYIAATIKNQIISETFTSFFCRRCSGGRHQLPAACTGAVACGRVRCQPTVYADRHKRSDGTAVAAAINCRLHALAQGGEFDACSVWRPVFSLNAHRYIATRQSPAMRCVCPKTMAPGMSFAQCSPAWNTTHPNDPFQGAAYARRLCRPALNPSYAGRHKPK